MNFIIIVIVSAGWLPLFDSNVETWSDTLQMTSFYHSLTLVFYLLFSVCFSWKLDKDYLSEDFDTNQDCPNGSRVDAMDRWGPFIPSLASEVDSKINVCEDWASARMSLVTTRRNVGWGCRTKRSLRRSSVGRRTTLSSATAEIFWNVATTTFHVQRIRTSSTWRWTLPMTWC